MKHEQNIDNLFRDGLKNSGMEYKPEYWQQMETALDKRRKNLLLRRESSLMILVVLLQAWLYFIPDASSTGQLLSDLPQRERDHTTELYETHQIEKTEESPENPDEARNKPEQSQMETESFSESSSSDERQVLPAAEANPLQVEDILPAVENDKMMADVVGDESSNDSYQPRLWHSSHVKARMPEIPQRSLNFDKSVSETKSPYFSRWFWHFEPYVSYQKHSYALGSSAPAELKNQEKSLASISYGFDLRLQKSRWSILSGLGIMTLNEQLSYKSSSFTYEIDSHLRVVNWSYGNTPSGNRLILVDWQQDTLSSTEHITECTSCSAQFSFLKIPLKVQYEFPVRIFKMHFGLGLNNHILFKTQGLYSASDQVVNIDQRPGFVNQYMSSGSLELGIRAPLWGPVSYQAAYSIEKSFHSMIGDYRQIPTIQNLKIGLSVRL
jgi:hypothetical protein